ncbi:MAG: hypothetical protein AAB862_01225, partial [Patescibacteria group bacterium]
RLRVAGCPKKRTQHSTKPLGLGEFSWNELLVVDRLSLYHVPHKKSSPKKRPKIRRFLVCTIHFYHLLFAIS